MKVSRAVSEGSRQTPIRDGFLRERVIRKIISRRGGEE
jgi:hypothetical protein